MRVKIIPKEAIAAAEARLFTKTKIRDLGATRASVEAFDGQSRVELRQVFVLASILGVNVWQLLDEESKLAVWNAVPVFKADDDADSVALFRAESLEALEAQLRNVSGAEWVSPESASGAGITSLPGALDNLRSTELEAIVFRTLFDEDGARFDSKHAHWVLTDEFSDEHIAKAGFNVFASRVGCFGLCRQGASHQNWVAENHFASSLRRVDHDRRPKVFVSKLLRHSSRASKEELDNIHI
jgi:hypothetical protein